MGDWQIVQWIVLCSMILGGFITANHNLAAINAQLNIIKTILDEIKREVRK
jgi:hypothetical protein